MTIDSGLEIFGIDVPRESQALGEGFAQANSYLLGLQWQAGTTPAPSSRVQSRTTDTVVGEYNAYGRGPIVISPTDFLPGRPGFDPHVQGYVAVQLLSELSRSITNRRVPNLSGCGGAANPLARWYGQSLLALEDRGAENPGFTEWCEAMAVNAPSWGVSADEVRRRFRRRGIPCGTPDPGEQVGLRLPDTCQVAGASANPSRGVLVRTGGACGV